MLDFEVRVIIGEFLKFADYAATCAFCGRRFRFYSQYREHVLIHSSERPYACEFCDARYNRKSNLTRHLQAEHQQGGTPCQICDVKYSRKGNLLKHLQNEHRLTESEIKKIAKKIGYKLASIHIETEEQTLAAPESSLQDPQGPT